MKKVIIYKDKYGTVYETRPVTDVQRKINHIQETNDNKAKIIEIK